MAKNREPEKTVEPESEYEESSDEEMESEPEPVEETNNKPPPPPSQQPSSSVIKKSQPSPPSQPPQQLSSSEEEGSESESEFEQNVLPLATISMDEKPHKSKVQPKPAAEEKNREAVKSPSKRTRASTSKQPEAASAKRPAEENEPEAKDGKRSKRKKKVEATPSESSKKPFQRLWSDNDEIVILKGYIAYEAENKCGPNVNMDAFLDFIKGDLHVYANKSQLADKIRKLKKRYENYKGKTLTPHELEAHGLSKAIWGGDNGVLMSHKNNVIESEDGDDVKVEVANGGVAKASGKRMGCSCGSANDKVMSIGTAAFEAEIEIEGSKEWKKLISDEIKIQLRKTELVADFLKR